MRQKTKYDTERKIKEREIFRKKYKKKLDLYRKLTRERQKRFYWKNPEESRRKLREKSIRKKMIEMREHIIICAMQQKWSRPAVATCAGISLRTLSALELACVIPKLDLDGEGNRIYTTHRVGFLTEAVSKFERTVYDARRIEMQFHIKPMRDFLQKWWYSSLDAYYIMLVMEDK